MSFKNQVFFSLRIFFLEFVSKKMPIIVTEIFKQNLLKEKSFLSKKEEGLPSSTCK